MLHQHVGNTGLALLDRRFLLSSVLNLCLDDVGNSPRAVPNAINGSTQRDGYSVGDKINLARPTFSGPAHLN
jgi:hypothetical protein